MNRSTTRRPLPHAALALVPIALFLAACGTASSSAAGGDASVDGVASTAGLDAAAANEAAPLDAPAADDAPSRQPDGGPLVLPQVLRLDGGPLAAPTLVAVTFPGDPLVTDIDAFTKAVGASQYWKAVTSEYGVGAAPGRSILETENAPAAIDQNNGDSEAWLATRFDGTHPEWGTFDPGAVYLVFYPSTTVATPSVGGCGGAYHDSIPITIPSAVDGGASKPGRLVYGIVFRCASSIDVGRPTGTDLTTFMASHEMVEAATDPYGTGYAQTDDAHVAWAYFFGSEVGDMCAFHPNVAVKPADIGYAVQRTWSNAAAAAFQDPCVPGESSPLFLAAPVGLNAITLPGAGGGTFASQGFSLPAGQSITVDVGFHGSAAGTWTVTPFTYTMEHGQPEPYLAFSPATLTGQSGDILPLTIKRVAANPDGNGGDAVKLVSAMGSASNEWYFTVTN